MVSRFFSRGANSSKAEMTFIDHLEALRWHLIRMMIAIIIAAIAILINIDWVFDNIIAGPINPNFVSYEAMCRFSHWAHLGDALCMPPIEVKMQTTTFGAQFMSSISIGFFGGVLLAFPYIAWELWLFVKPALRTEELKNSRFAIFWVSLFFFLGVAFGFFILAPFTFNFLGNYKLGTLQLLDTRPSLTDYLDNLIDITMGCGLAFELPVASYVLTRMGIITPEFLKRSRKFAILLILIVAAIITPSPDWISQMLVFVPLFLLYQLSILVSAKVRREEVKQELKEWS